MACEDTLSRASEALNSCLRHFEKADACALGLAVANAYDCMKVVATDLECIANNQRHCGRDRCCVTARDVYKRRLLEIDAVLLHVRALLESERGRLAREIKFLHAARSWAEFSQPFAGAPPETERGVRQSEELLTSHAQGRNVRSPD